MAVILTTVKLDISETNNQSDTAQNLINFSHLDIHVLHSENCTFEVDQVIE